MLGVCGPATGETQPARYQFPTFRVGFVLPQTVRTSLSKTSPDQIWFWPRLVLDRQNIENITEDRLFLGLIFDNKCRWPAQIEHTHTHARTHARTHTHTHTHRCKIMSKELFLSQLQHTINIDNQKIFYNAHIKPHIDYASVVWGGCSEVHLKRTIVHLKRTIVHLKYSTLKTNYNTLKTNYSTLKTNYSTLKIQYT